ncbi:MAG TPA: GTPase HflX [Acidimicrobiales bacterium]|jgi:GTP-binding protein HflX|nr:GTPase HflX [Acidimicrobiales bacterium]
MTVHLPGTLITREFRERIILVGVVLPGTDPEAVEAYLDELTELVDTAGADVVARIVQRRDHPDPATFIGSGKAKELAELAEKVDADTVVFDDELSPAQQRNLEKLLGRTAIDRTAVILDIFAQNARSPEGRAQVELALLRYRLPRLRGRGGSLSQQAGGIGTRGPGETQLEVDRRRLVRRMHRLEADIRGVEQTRTLQRRSRRRGRHRELALVGYTNTGKSTLLNRLTGAGVPAENRLFVTLDPRTRQLALPGGETVLVTDTVGFVRKLPHELVEAFRSTLDSVRLAELVVHVVDGSAADPEAQMAAVRTVMEEIGAGGLPELLVVNKADRAPDEAKRLAAGVDGSVLISARTGEGIDDLLRTIGDRVRAADRVVELVIPWARGDVLAAVHREGEVVEQEAGDEAARVHVVLDDAGRARFREYMVVSA